MCENHERNPCAPRFERRAQDETLHQDAPAVFKNTDNATFYSPIETRATPAPTSKSPEERELVVDSGASMHMLSTKDLSSDEIETLRRSRNTTTVVTAKGEVQTNEETQVFVHELDLFVTVHILDGTPAVLSLGKLCEEHGYSCEWPHLT